MDTERGTILPPNHTPPPVIQRLSLYIYLYIQHHPSLQHITTADPEVVEVGEEGLEEGGEEEEGVDEDNLSR